MSQDAIVATMESCRISAILRTNNADTAAKAMEAAVAGGFRMVEFTLTTPGALELIQNFSSREGLLVGAGTVLTPGQAKEAVNAGARFLVSPVVDEAVIATAASLKVVSVPGAFTATEIYTAHRAGAGVVKIFPAPADVPAFVTQIRGPLPGIRLFPTAGVTVDNFNRILKAGAFGVGFVASLFTPEDLASGNFDAIQDRAIRIHQELESNAPPN